MPVGYHIWLVAHVQNEINSVLGLVATRNNEMYIRNIQNAHTGIIRLSHSGLLAVKNNCLFFSWPKESKCPHIINQWDPVLKSLTGRHIWYETDESSNCGLNLDDNFIGVQWSKWFQWEKSEKNLALNSNWSLTCVLGLNTHYLISQHFTISVV